MFNWYYAAACRTRHPDINILLQILDREVALKHVKQDFGYIYKLWGQKADETSKNIVEKKWNTIKFDMQSLKCDIFIDNS